MRLKIKNRSYRDDINRRRPEHGHKHTKYKKRVFLHGNE